MVKKKGDNPLAGLTRFNVDPNPVTLATLRRNILITDSLKEEVDDLKSSEDYVKREKKNKWGINFHKEGITKHKEKINSLLTHQKNVMEGRVTPLQSGSGWHNTNEIPKSVLMGERSEIVYGDKNISGIEKNYPPSYGRNPYYYSEYGPEEYREAASVATKYKYADAKSSWSHGSYEKQNKMPKHVAELNAAEPWRSRNPEEYGSNDTTGEYKEWIKTQYDTAAHGAPKVTVADIFTPGYKPTEGFKLKNPVGESTKPVKEHMTSPQFAQYEQLSFDFPKNEQLSLF